MKILSSISQHTLIPLWAVWLIAVVVLIVGAGRITRAVTYDDFPPTMWLRVKWDLLTETSDWNKLLHCYWCFGQWAAAFAMAWFAIGLVVDWIMAAWWIVFVALALGYLVSMLVNRDEAAGTDVEEQGD